MFYIQNQRLLVTHWHPSREDAICWLSVEKQKSGIPKTKLCPFISMLIKWSQQSGSRDAEKKIRYVTCRAGSICLMPTSIRRNGIKSKQSVKRSRPTTPLMMRMWLCSSSDKYQSSWAHMCSISMIGVTLVSWRRESSTDCVTSRFSQETQQRSVKPEE